MGSQRYTSKPHGVPVVAMGYKNIQMGSHGKHVENRENPLILPLLRSVMAKNLGSHIGNVLAKLHTPTTDLS